MENNLKKEEVMNFIVKYQFENGFPPAIREICTGTNTKSTSTVHKYLTVLEKEGYVKINKKISRGLQILKNINL